MKKLALVLLGLALVASPAFAQKVAGNGAPSGGHYNLNIIGHDTCLGGEFTDSSRHVISVLLRFSDGSQNGQLYSTLDKRNKIFLQPGSEFRVLDGSACNGAQFQLPADVSTAWTVWARALGKPGGSASVTSCAAGAGEDGTIGTADDEIVCSTADNVLDLNRVKGPGKFVNVTDKLLYVCADTTGDGVCDTSIPLFDSQLYDYFWDYDNNGLRLAQLRFYPVQ